jgi:hypothetical protein
MTELEKIAQAILALSYSDLTEMAGELVMMQNGAKDEGWEWVTSEVYGEKGLAQMLHSWAESQ